MKNPLYYHKVGGVKFPAAIARLKERDDAGPFMSFVRYVADIDDPVERAEVATELFRVFDEPTDSEWLPRHASVTPILGKLFEQGWDPEWRDHDGRTLMHCAAGFGEQQKAAEACGFLAERGLDPLAESKQGARPISYASRSRWSGFSPLHDALSRPLTPKSREFIIAMTKSGEDPNGIDMRTGSRPLHLLMMTHEGQEHPSFIRDNVADILLERGANPNLRNPNGFTALHLAHMAPESERICERMVSFGGDLALPDGVGRTADALAALAPTEKRVVLEHSVRKDRRYAQVLPEMGFDEAEDEPDAALPAEGETIEIVPVTPPSLMIDLPLRPTAAPRPVDLRPPHAEERLSIHPIPPPFEPEAPKPKDDKPAAPGQAELF